ncbi:phosphatase PAP2 family protein [Hymenobacter properus]|uniref:Phosphatase PAP2 family protein n=1 Tax=Hymenobacter properus TaxID=2791026 RepID=A0A931BF50_9BACT|nr:phosphatase PAP2 family protein [Hymenobacter properus]MBF9142279.1 phosphatase PAP2 family protein [Hymenobacter properus]MBR7721086.1 phosphatase PAP2 family protein [Microvirga sp. SRT04]
MHSFWLRLRHALRAHKLLLLALLAGLVLPWVVFVNVAEDIWESGGFVGDKAILEFWHAHATPALDRLALAFTAAGDPLPMSLLALATTLALARWGRRPQAWFFALSVGGAMLLNLLVKVLFARPRPALWVSLKPAFYYSFPSGHAMGAAAVVTALGFLLKRHRYRGLVWGLGLLFALGVGWSRLYLGVHYPSDVLAGWTGSVGWVAGLHLLFSPEFHRLRRLWRAALHRRWPRLVAPPADAPAATA